MSSTPSDAFQDDAASALRLGPVENYRGSPARKVCQRIKGANLSLAVHIGEILRPGVICRQLGISHRSVSEAMTRCAVEGLVDVDPQADNFVSRLFMNAIREGVGLLEALEPQAVKKAADTGFAGFYRLAAEMHALILSYAGYRRMSMMTETSRLQVNRARQLVLPNPAPIAEAPEEHARIVAALAAHDPETARALTRDHLRQLISSLEPFEREHPETL